MICGTHKLGLIPQHQQSEKVLQQSNKHTYLKKISNI